MSDITSASQEQSEGIEQVNHAITQMDEVTQQNAALVEQASAAAENMQSQAGKLTQLVDSFKLVSGAQTTRGGNVQPAASVSTTPVAREPVAAIRKASPKSPVLSLSGAHMEVPG
jgi:hypothetical protein